MRHGANSDSPSRDRQRLNSTDDVTQQTRPRSSVIKNDSARQKSWVLQDDDERGNAHSDARQPSRPADNDQRRRRRRRTSSSSSTEDSRDDNEHGAQQRDQQSPRPHQKSSPPLFSDESSSSDEEDEVGEVRAEDSGLQERRKKSSLETALPKSTNTHDDASARLVSGRAAICHAEEEKSTYTYGNASARPMGRAAACHAEERNSTRQLKSTYTPVDASA